MWVFLPPLQSYPRSFRLEPSASILAGSHRWQSNGSNRIKDPGLVYLDSPKSKAQGYAQTTSSLDLYFACACLFKYFVKTPCLSSTALLLACDLIHLHLSILIPLLSDSVLEFLVHSIAINTSPRDPTYHRLWFLFSSWLRIDIFIPWFALPGWHHGTRLVGLIVRRLGFSAQIWFLRHSTSPS